MFSVTRERGISVLLCCHGDPYRILCLNDDKRNTLQLQENCDKQKGEKIVPASIVTSRHRPLGRISCQLLSFAF